MNLLETSTREKIINRINQLSSENQASWGKMNANQMICHVTDQLRIAFGEKGQPEKAADLMGRTLIKFLVLYVIPIPKNVRTSKKADQVDGDGTPPTSFEADRQTLLSYIEKFVQLDEDFSFTPHFKFGALTKQEWAKLAAKHLDHHLKQFGV